MGSLSLVHRGPVMLRPHYSDLLSETNQNSRTGTMKGSNGPCSLPGLRANLACSRHHEEKKRTHRGMDSKDMYILWSKIFIVKDGGNFAPHA